MASLFSFISGDSECAIFWPHPIYPAGKGLELKMTDGASYSWRGFPSTRRTELDPWQAATRAPGLATLNPEYIDCTL